MASRTIDLMIASIKRQNDYDYKMEEDKERIKKNIDEYKNKINKEKNIKKEILEKRMEEVQKNNKKKNDIKNNEIINNNITKNPLESIIFNNKPLVPVFKDNVYDYVNKYNFDRYKILNENEENRMRISKSVNFKINNYSINKKLYMDNIKNYFGQKNVESRKKTEKIFQEFKKSNEDLKNKMNLESAKRYHNFNNYLKKRELDNEQYNDILINKRIMAKEKYDNYFQKKDELILKRIRDLRYGRIEDDYSDAYKRVDTKVNNNIKRKRSINVLRKIEAKDLEKMKQLHDDNVVKLNIEKEKKIKQILDNENKNFKKANMRQNIIDNTKNNCIINSINNNLELEKKLKEAKNKYERNYKSEIIYKKGQF
jgi:hypothetical protein